MKVYAELRLTGPTLDINAISQSVGVVPTKAWNAGDKIPGTDSGKRRFARWAICTEQLETTDISKAIELLMTQTKSVAPLIADLAKKYSAKFEVSCAVYADHQNSSPALYFDANLIHWLSDVGAVLDIDLYPGNGSGGA